MFPPPSNLAEARRFAAGRSGRVAWAVVDTRGRLAGHRAGHPFPAASVVKAMLLVAYLNRRAEAGEALGRADRALLDPMIRLSDNRAATGVYAVVGDVGLRRVASRARMRAFQVAGYWGSARITAADQARFFVRIDRLTAAPLRPYARRLLARVASYQRWGIHRSAPLGWSVFLKGGWRPTPQGRLVHEAALLERGRRRMAVVILTDAGRSHGYGVYTIRGVARRLLAAPGERKPSPERPL